MRSKGRILTMLVLVALAAPAARADQKDDLFNQAQQLAASNPFESARLYCQVADMDPTYKNAKMMCGVMSGEAKKVGQRNEDNYKACVDATAKGDFEEAKQKCRNVKQGGPKYPEAQQYLTQRIPQAEKELKSKADIEQAAAQKLQEGKQAYARNDFPGAKAALGQVNPSSAKAGEAQDLQNKISQYEGAMRQGDQLLNAKNYKAAHDAYIEAASIKGDGPGDPRGKAQRAVDSQSSADAAAAAAAAEAQRRTRKPSLALRVTPNSGQAALTVNATASATAQDGGTRVVGTQIQWGDGSETNGASGSHVYKNAGTYDVVAWVTDDAGAKISQTQTVRVIEAAVKQVAPEVDVAKTLAEARAAKQKGNVALAKGKYMKVLAADKTNKEALDALDELSKQAAATPATPTPEPQTTPGVISEADTLLAKGITEFYTGQFDDAYSDLRDYLKFKGEKVGLANFYMGALKATQYHLSGATDPKLQEAATNAFRVAKKTPKFKPPEKYISPKILEMYNNSGM